MKQEERTGALSPGRQGLRAAVRRGAACILAAAVLLNPLATAAEELSVVETHQPTCDQNGYTLYQDMMTGAYFAGDEIPALGHIFTPWTDGETGSIRTCERCDAIDSFPYRVQGELVHIALTGSTEGIGKKSLVQLDTRLVNPDVSFTGSALVSYQGHSTLELEKHNYTIRLYEDGTLGRKLKISFRDWHNEHKYILKANYWDVSLCRNLVCAGVWRELVRTRGNVDPHLAAQPNGGAVAGIPAAVWLNDDFIGLYTLNLHKDNDLYGMEKGERHAVMILNAQTTDESLFRAESDFIDGVSDWELEYCGTEDTAWATDSLNELIRFVNSSTDEEFRALLPQRLDVEAAIDYLLFIYAMGLTDSSAKDLVLVNYGEHWIPTVYDMEDAFGLYPMSTRVRDVADMLPQRTETGWDSGTGSLLWDRLLTVFEPEVLQRWQQLRMSYLAPKYVTDQVKAFMGSIPETYYAMDQDRYPDRGAAYQDQASQIETYIYNRYKVLNEAFRGE